MNERAISTASTQALLAAPIPVSALLAVWVNAWCAGKASGDDLVDAMTFANAQRIASGDAEDADDAGPESLIVGLTRLGCHPGAPNPPQLRVVLPTTGDPRGLPGPKELNIAAIDVGEIVISDDLQIALLPHSIGVSSVWAVAPIERNRAAAAVRPEQAPSAVRAALHEAMLGLQSLDITSSASQIRSEIAELTRTLNRTPLPMSLSGPDRHTIHSAATIIGICAFALADNPTQVTAELEARRRALISELSATARHALAATCSAR
jgi:hypothetical protein